MFFTAMLITYIKGRTPALIVLERGSAMTIFNCENFFVDLDMLNILQFKLSLYL
jgi:hypothetical protein